MPDSQTFSDDVLLKLFHKTSSAIRQPGHHLNSLLLIPLLGIIKHRQNSQVSFYTSCHQIHDTDSNDEKPSHEADDHVHGARIVLILDAIFASANATRQQAA